MRINIYAEELTQEVTIVTKKVTDEKFGDRTFYGLRIWLKSPPELHDDPMDDDRSAITFWLPWTKQDGHNIGFWQELFHKVWEVAADIRGQAAKDNEEKR